MKIDREIELCQVCLIDTSYEDGLCEQCLGVEPKKNINFNEPNIMRVEIDLLEWEKNYNKVVDTVQSCETIDQLEGAKKFALNFFNTYSTLPDEHMEDRRGKVISIIQIKKLKIEHGISDRVQ